MVALEPDWDQLMDHLQSKLSPKYKARWDTRTPAACPLPLTPLDLWQVWFVHPSEAPELRWIRVGCPLGMLDIFGVSKQQKQEGGEGCRQQPQKQEGGEGVQAT